MNIEKINVGGNDYDITDAMTRNMISDAYDQARSYKVGEFCIYENVLYKCKTAATGVWDATKWTATSVDVVFSEQNEKISNAITRIQISGTTSAYGLITVITNTKFTQTPFILTNIHDASSTPYILDVQAYSSTQMVIRVRSFIDGSAVANTSVNFAALLIGV